jgi:MYXO-CTERM domain-containing protein
MKTALFVATAAASLVASADAGFAGFVAFSRNVGANTVIDVFAAVDNAGDKFLNVYNSSSNGVFVQKAGLSSKTWKPDAANFTSTRSVSDDSFMTAGTFSGGSYGGEYYASGNTTADPNFTGTSWNGTPASAAATSIPALAGWFSNDPPSVDNNAELMSAWGSGFTRTDGTGAAGKSYGIWVSHLVVAGNNKVIGVDFTFSAFASIKDVGGAVSQLSSSFPVPAPGAIALVGLAGLAAGRRRRA